ncbi:MAG: hypothetical protein FCKEOINB_02975 [Nitrosomonas sp.]|nr:hypothetical protein [Nitrosomonas sp.]
MLKTPFDTFEFRQRLDNGGIRHTDLIGDRNGGQRILDIMQTGYIQRDIEFPGGTVYTDNRGKFHAVTVLPDVNGAHLRLFGQAVRGDRFGNQRHHFADIGVVHANHRHAVKRQVLQEIHEGLLQPAEVVTVSFHMIRIDVRHDRQHRL